MLKRISSKLIVSALIIALSSLPLIALATSWITASGAPASSLGASGMYYLDSASNKIWFNYNHSWQFQTVVVAPGSTIQSITLCNSSSATQGQTITWNSASSCYNAVAINSSSATLFSSGILLGQSFYASLGSASNGTMIYCSDCKIASSCANNGTGAIAKMLNGSWVCN